MKRRYVTLKGGYRNPAWEGKLGPNGRGLCRWCGTEVPAGRATWCSDRCVQEYRIRSSASAMRYAIWKRDQGKCALCKTDTEAIKRTLFRHEQVLHSLLEPILSKLAVKRGTFIHLLNAADQQEARRRPKVKKMLEEFEEYLAGLPPELVKCWRKGRSLWEADHIKPVVEGGGGCGLENVRSLCVACHHIETHKLQTRLAARRWKKKLDGGRA